MNMYKVISQLIISREGTFVICIEPRAGQFTGCTRYLKLSLMMIDNVANNNLSKNYSIV